MIDLMVTRNSDPYLWECMKRHYSEPRGFVGRNICYAIFYEGVYFGHTVGGSATKHLPGRDEYLGVDKASLNNVVNNNFFHVYPPHGKYPIRNFTTKVVQLFEKVIQIDWFKKYGDEVIGFETLVEKPRTGELYLKAHWEVVGETKGFTCKRVAGNGTDSWTGKRVWDTENLRPKLILCRRS